MTPPPALLPGLLTDLLTAVMLLTRLPVARFMPAAARPEPAKPNPAQSLWAFPIVGAGINGFGGLVYWLLHEAGVSPAVAAAWTLAMVIAATGALHDDGLADTADGFGGGATPARKLAIMRDSRIGAFGAVAVMVSVIIRVSAVAALDHPAQVVLAMIAAGVLGRGAILVLLMLLRPARADGMGAAIADVRAKRLAAGGVLAVAIVLLVLPVRLAVAAVVLALGASLALARLARVQIGGYTGDVLGAAEVVAECVVLTVATSRIF